MGRCTRILFSYCFPVSNRFFIRDLPIINLLAACLDNFLLKEVELFTFLKNY